MNCKRETTLILCVYLKANSLLKLKEVSDLNLLVCFVKLTWMDLSKS